MNNLYHLTRILMLIMFCCSFTTTLSRATYLGQEISAETIIDFIEPLPQDAAPVIKWIKKHTKELRYLAAHPKPLSRWEDKKFGGNKCLLKCGLKNLGSNNYVFEVPGTQWLIKISGPLRRVVNLYAYNTGKDPYEPGEYKRHKGFYNGRLLNSFKKMPTFATISRFANWLLCQDVILRNNIDNVYFPDIYLVHIPGNPNELSDENYIVVEKKVSHIKNICTTKRSSDALTKHALKQLYYIITQSGIFDFNGENLQIDGHNNLVFIDLEQGIVENPAHFFNKDKEMFDYRVLEGLSSFIEYHAPKGSREYEFLRSLVIADEAIESSEEWYEIKKLFSLQGHEKIVE